jgi:hypothetical protein
VKTFYTAGHLMDVLSLFGELDEQLVANRKYAKWKATYIHNCLKNGETPVPGPPGGFQAGEDYEPNVGGNPSLGFDHLNVNDEHDFGKNLRVVNRILGLLFNFVQARPRPCLLHPPATSLLALTRNRCLLLHPLLISAPVSSKLLKCV